MNLDSILPFGFSSIFSSEEQPFEDSLEFSSEHEKVMDHKASESFPQSSISSMSSSLPFEQISQGAPAGEVQGLRKRKYDHQVTLNLGSGNSANGIATKALKFYGMPTDQVDLRTVDDPINEEIPSLAKLTHHSRLYIIGHCSPGSDYIVSDEGKKITVNQFVEIIKRNAPQLKNRDGLSSKERLKISIVACYAGAGDQSKQSFALRLSQALAKEGIEAEVLGRVYFVSRWDPLKPAAEYNKLVKGEHHPEGSKLSFITDRLGKTNIEHIIYSEEQGNQSCYLFTKEITRTKPLTEAETEIMNRNCHKINRQEAEDLLKSQRNGSWLIRYNEKAERFVTSIMKDGEIEHRQHKYHFNNFQDLTAKHGKDFFIEPLVGDEVNFVKVIKGFSHGKMTSDQANLKLKGHPKDCWFLYEDIEDSCSIKIAISGGKKSRNIHRQLKDIPQNIHDFTLIFTPSDFISPTAPIQSVAAGFFASASLPLSFSFSSSSSLSASSSSSLSASSSFSSSSSSSSSIQTDPGQEISSFCDPLYSFGKMEKTDDATFEKLLKKPGDWLIRYSERVERPVITKRTEEGFIHVKQHLGVTLVYVLISKSEPLGILDRQQLVLPTLGLVSKAPEGIPAVTPGSVSVSSEGVVSLSGQVLYDKIIMRFSLEVPQSQKLEKSTADELRRDTETFLRDKAIGTYIFRPGSNGIALTLKTHENNIHHINSVNIAGFKNKIESFKNPQDATEEFEEWRKTKK